MLLQQLAHGAQDIGPVLPLLRPLFGLQQGKLMPQIGDATIQARHASGCIECRRRFKSEPPRRSNIEPGVEADFEIVGCG